MPVLLQKISDPSDQDWVYLSNIAMAVFPSLHSEKIAELKEWSNRANDEGEYFFTIGRFNDRIVCVIKSHQLNQKVYFTDWWVHEKTQRRGVSHQMIQLLKKWANENDYEIHIKDVPIRFHGVLSRYQLTKYQNSFAYLPLSR
jgi:RimJ/RimL family protein N-acetyltransferase